MPCWTIPCSNRPGNPSSNGNGVFKKGGAVEMGRWGLIDGLPVPRLQHMLPFGGVKILLELAILLDMVIGCNVGNLELRSQLLDDFFIFYWVRVRN
ncbi:hypothetical protein M0R45_032538 [Rubus argutus]|uniref:Uncharacterized protein n=1 Tax=Rubus argutus TaxID=59490 RepID=A0AAW1WGV8_RUBAR